MKLIEEVYRSLPLKLNDKISIFNLQYVSNSCKISEDVHKMCNSIKFIESEHERSHLNTGKNVNYLISIVIAKTE